ncbi:MAG: twin-arginine translocase subunit TatC [Betaproteobacteria bacterium]|jgi:sec-independent protein translocase protein TatC
MSDLPQDNAQEETFFSHLVELRDRIIKASIAILVVFMSMVYWAPDIFHALADPMLKALPAGAHMIVTDVTGSFFVPIKVTFMAAFVVALPVVIYQIWAFIAPGLYHHEKKLVLPIVISTYTLFLIGMAFAYFLVFPTVFGFMVQYNAPLGADMSTDIDKYLSFAMTTFLAFGFTFEVPVVVVVLVRMGIVTLAKLKEMRPYVIVGAFVVAAVATPPDVMSQLLLAVPLCILFEIGLLIARFYQPKPKEDEEELAKEPV